MYLKLVKEMKTGLYKAVDSSSKKEEPSGGILQLRQLQISEYSETDQYQRVLGSISQFLRKKMETIKPSSEVCHVERGGTVYVYVKYRQFQVF